MLTVPLNGSKNGSGGSEGADQRESGSGKE